MITPASTSITIGCVNITVSGYKFHDLNANGVRDANEPGLEGWVINLQGSSGAFTTTTDENGYYLFEGLKPGVYQVRETPQTGWYQSFPAGEGFYNISVSSERSSATADFGNYRTAQVFGYKYIDINGSGEMEDGEPGLEGVRIYVLDLSGNLVAETLTDADGYFEIQDIHPGQYALYEEIPEGMYQSQPGPAQGGFYYLVLGSGNEVGPKNFGNYILTSIEGLVYYEGSAPPKGVAGSSIMTDRFAAPGVVVTGVRTGPAPLKPGADVVLPGASSFEIATDEDGYFKVDGLLPGLYTLQVQPPEFVTVITTNPLTEILVSGGFVEIEFGLFYDALAAPEPSGGSITGSLFRDGNGNGLWAFPTETGIEGRTVTLTGTSSRGASLSRSATTDANGTYTFAGLPAGSYLVSAPSSAGHSTSAPLGASYTVKLGANEHLGAGPSGGPGGAGWLQATEEGSDVSFATMTLALDTNLDGVADTRVDLAGKASFSLGGLRGQTSRPLELVSVQMYGLAGDGHQLTLTTPGLVAGEGAIVGPGALADKDLSAGLILSHEDESFWMSEVSLSFAGTVDRWPLRHSRATFGVGNGPVNMRDPNGNVVARIVFAEITTLYGADFAVERADFGDAPATYGTLRALPGDPFVVTTTGIVYPLDGARHLMPWTGSPALRLGASVSADANGQPGASADGDSDDGVELPAAVAPNSAFEATVSVTGAGLLSVWVDQNRNGVFEPSERLVSDVAVTTGEYDVTLHSGATNSSGVTFVRVRLTSQAGVGPTGLALDGEVEDYMLTIDASLASGGGGLPTSDDGDAGLPTSFALHQNYPNPFNPTTVIPYDLAAPGNVRLTVYDVTGRPVASLLNAFQNAGRHQIAFNAAGLPSGVYMVRLEAGGQLMVRKLTLLK
jgi:protocatechuate 3,4-dioxygenase beta subunit